MPPGVALPLRDRVAVGEQYGEARLVGAQRHIIARQDVRSVGEEGDAAKTFRLTLGAKQAATGVQTHQLAVGIRRQFDQRFDAMC